MIIEKFEDIEAWKEARKMVNRVYRVCSVNGFERDFSLADQMKRAAVSIMANIAEGYARNGNKEFIRFLFIAKSSAAELQSHFYVAFDQGYIDNEDFQEIYRDLDKIQRMLSNFIKNLPARPLPLGRGCSRLLAFYVLFNNLQWCPAT